MSHLSCRVNTRSRLMSGKDVKEKEISLSKLRPLEELVVTLARLSRHRSRRLHSLAPRMRRRLIVRALLSKLGASDRTWLLALSTQRLTLARQRRIVQCAPASFQRSFQQVFDMPPREDRDRVELILRVSAGHEGMPRLLICVLAAQFFSEWGVSSACACRTARP
jgi:hypothetical protein